MSRHKLTLIALLMSFPLCGLLISILTLQTALNPLQDRAAFVWSIGLGFFLTIGTCILGPILIRYHRDQPLLHLQSGRRHAMVIALGFTLSAELATETFWFLGQNAIHTSGIAQLIFLNLGVITFLAVGIFMTIGFFVD